MQAIHDNFLALKAHISTKLINIATIDLWNEQPSFEAQEHPIITPAVYLEYSPISWSKVSNARQGIGTLLVHIIRDNVADSFTINGTPAANEQEALKRFATMQALQYVLECWQHATCKPLELIGSATDHNHDALLHDTLTYKLVLIDAEMYNVNNAYNVAGTLPDIDIQPNTVPTVPVVNTSGYTVPTIP
jgi:hypothetical protein